MRNRVAVVMFCGPFLESGNVETLRITHAIHCALKERGNLYIIGNVHGRLQTELYQSMAKEHGLSTVRLLASSDAQTITYAKSVADLLKVEDHPVTKLFLVTDDWHMFCAHDMLSHCLKNRGLSIQIDNIEVKSALRPSERVLDALNHEIREFSRREMGVCIPTFAQPTT